MRNSITGLLVVLVLGAGLNTVNAQTVHQLIGTSDDDIPSCIEKTEDDGYIISGENTITVSI